MRYFKLFEAMVRERDFSGWPLPIAVPPPPKLKPEACEIAGPEFSIPGIECDECGQTWATDARIRRELPADHPLRRRKTWPAPPDEVFRWIELVRRAFDLPGNLEIRPDTSIGPLRVKIRRCPFLGIQWPRWCSPVITGDVERLFLECGLTGWYAAEIDIRSVPRGRDIPRLVELVPVGKGGPAILPTPLVPEAVCKRCDRVSYGKWPPQPATIDPNQWDGSDFFRLDPPFHGPIWVTERVRNALLASPFEGYELFPLEALGLTPTAVPGWTRDATHPDYVCRGLVEG